MAEKQKDANCPTSGLYGTDALHRIAYSFPLPSFLHPVRNARKESEMVQEKHMHICRLISTISPGATWSNIVVICRVVVVARSSQMK
jgi:hypothetical protein